MSVSCRGEPREGRRNREGAEEGGNSLPVSKLKEVRAAENAAENATGLREVQSRSVRGVLVVVEVMLGV